MSQQSIHHAHEIDAQPPPAITHEDDAGHLPLVPVRIPHSLDVQGQAADYGGFSAYHLAGTEAAQPVLPFDSYRHRAVISVSPSITPNAGQTLFGYGVVTAPTASQLITTNVQPGAGTWSVLVTTYLDGTTTAADDDNMKVVASGIRTLGTITQPSNADVPVTSGPYIITTTASTSISVQAVAAGGASAVYHAVLVVTPVGPSNDQPFIYLGSQAQCQTKTAGVLYAGQQVVVENNQQLWMAPDGTDPLVVTVLAERWDSGS